MPELRGQRMRFFILRVIPSAPFELELLDEFDELFELELLDEFDELLELELLDEFDELLELELLDEFDELFELELLDELDATCRPPATSSMASTGASGSSPAGAAAWAVWTASMVAPARAEILSRDLVMSFSFAGARQCWAD